MLGRVMSSLGADMKIKYPSVKCEQQPRPERAALPATFWWDKTGDPAFSPTAAATVGQCTFAKALQIMTYMKNNASAVSLSQGNHGQVVNLNRQEVILV